MPPRGLPGNANLEQLRNGAKSFARAVRSGDPGAADVVREFHPRLASAEHGSPELQAFSHADALLVVARRFDFESWPKLKSFLESTQELTRSPHHAPPGVTPADEFLRLACLNYGNDEPERIAAARQMLARSPELSRATIHAAAAAGAVDAACVMLGRDPALAGARGGPFEWEPLLYLAYSRVGDAPPERSALETARLLLDHGADPNAGYLWEGLCPPFTALTGALGGGENGPPAHEQRLALARLLLERGADPNDGQGLYNQAGDPSEEWLELLLEFGLGRGEGSGRWYRLFGERLASPRQLLENLIMPAAGLGLTSRVRRLLELGVDPDGTGTRHPIYEGRTPVQEAARGGNPEVVEMLRAAGADSALDDVDLFLAACGDGDRDRTEAMRTADPTLLQQAIARRPGQIIAAAEHGKLEAVALLIELGFDVNALERTSPLHEAAMRGNLEMIHLLLDHRADPELRDTGYDATPAGWAEHFRQREAKELLHARESVHKEAVETDLRYGPADPVRVIVVHRAQRLFITDGCGAVDRSGRPEGSQSAFDRIARSLDVNVQRTGEVWLPVVTAGPGVEAITKRIADASLALYQELLELQD
ncbi:MAG: ankyrin repeat domain-containing protein [Solirubrobacterales bacterium]|nr:ankyrin repeat domain-containing protein [Solirubrobacterales bacterium]